MEPAWEKIAGLKFQLEPAWEKVNGRKFAPVENQDKKGELRPYYSLTKTECLYTVAIRDTAYW